MKSSIQNKLFKQAFIRCILFMLLVFLSKISYTQNLPSNFIFQWIGSPEKVRVLDSLIRQSNTLALNQNDYNTIVIKQLKDQPKTLENYKDSLAAEIAIQKTATHFFNDLAYGNKIPELDYRGVKFDLISYNVPALIKLYNQENQLRQLPQSLNEKSIEVKKILDTLNQLQKSSSKNKEKIQLLIKAANDYRWLNAVRNKQRIVLVNIPSAQLKVYDDASITLQMKLILGKSSTPTKTLSAYIKQVTINPYWTVPKSIIVNEMLPKIQNDISYLSRNHLEVLGTNYKPINPYSINWYSIDLSKFPYIIRQATGCENSLGILKLEFDNPFSMYLHDTPEKQLFGYKNRFFSHGCMRMENPVGIGRLLLQDNIKAIDTIDLTKCYLNPKPIFIPVATRTPLIVWYSQVDFDSNNNLLFYKNVYNR
jgi:lipoprotein-anchoring transpeptidase ErfK/SrfK